MPDLHRIPQLHDQANVSWHDESSPEPVPLDAWQTLVLAQHRANMELWHKEDEARNPNSTDAEIAAVKRTIDSLNQRRNDLAEQLDSSLLQRMPAQNASSPLHSETPGLIIDRLSILSLKIFHTDEQVLRDDVDESHRERNRMRLTTLKQQRQDLADCLVVLWEDILAGRRRFQLYQQLKMYNDPTLNPVLYKVSAKEETARHPRKTHTSGSSH